MLNPQRTLPRHDVNRVVDAVHAATLDALESDGYDVMSLPAVAERAGVNKSTVYRRWPTKADLIADVLEAMVVPDTPAIDTGGLHSDIAALLTGVAAATRVGRVRAIMMAVLAVADDDPHVSAAQNRFWDARYRANRGIVDRAVERRELPDGTDPHVVLELAVTPVYFRSMFTDTPVTPEYIDEVTSRTVRAFRPSV